MLDFIKGLPLKVKIPGGIILFLIVFYIIFGGDYRAQQKNGGTTEVVETTEVTTEEETTELSREQQKLNAKYGEPPEGYMWSSTGTAIPLGNADMSPEEVLYAYMKACSLLDFSSATRYVTGSSVISRYEAYYGTGEYDAYDSFVRDVYKRVLTLTNIKDIVDTAVFNDGSYVYTVNLSTVDLSNKDFWVADKENLFLQMYNLNYYERDNLKARSFLYDYLEEYYNSDSVQMVEKQIDIKIEMGTDGYLVTDDSAVDAICNYTDGEAVIDYIFDEYETWYKDYEYKLKLEQQEAEQKAAEKAAKKAAKSSK
jgi:hypothetical protein